ncbi:hypothetical protein B0H13DRAFT_2368567 [Mycena leptocephala]|nr:hypothetical protein B0H13DRAFT_2368567 [Mycena leptocephala]
MFWDQVPPDDIVNFHNYHWQSENKPDRAVPTNLCVKDWHPVLTQWSEKDDEALEQLLTSLHPCLPSPSDVVDVKSFKAALNSTVYAVPQLLNHSSTSVCERRCHLVEFQEHLILYDFVQDMAIRVEDAKMANIVGSKGIGKTYALWYLLIKRLKKGHPTIYTINKYSYFFSAAGVQRSMHSPDSSEARAWLDTYRTDGNITSTWVLIDARGLKPEEREGWIWFQPVPWQAVFASSNSWLVEIYTTCVTFPPQSRTSWFLQIWPMSGPLLTRLGPSFPHLYEILAATNMKSTEHEYMQGIKSILANSTGDVLMSIASTPSPSSSELAALPPGLFTIVRSGSEFFEEQIIFSSRPMRDQFFHMYSLLRNDKSNLSWQFFEAIAFDFLTSYFSCQYRWMPMKVQRGRESNDQNCVDKQKGKQDKEKGKEKKGKSQFSTWELDAREEVLFEDRRKSHLYVRRSTDPLKRKETWQSDDEPPAKMIKVENRSGGGDDGGDDDNGDKAEAGPSESGPVDGTNTTTSSPLTEPDDEPLPCPPPFTHRIYFEVGQYNHQKGSAITPNILHVAMNPRQALFDAIALHDGTGYVYQVFDRNGEANHFMKTSGIPCVKAMLPKKTPVVFIALIPAGKNATLWAPESAAEFAAWHYYSLEIDLQGTDGMDEQ